MQWKADWSLRGRMLLTMVLLGVLYVVFMAVLWTFTQSLILVVVLLGVFSLGQLLYSDKLALRSLGASEVDPSEYPGLHQTIERLAQQADLPKPTVAVAESGTPNAFATGRSQDSATVCVTTGLLDTLDSDELEGVLAHELAHVKNRDVIVMTIASFLSTIAFMIVRWGWLFSGGGGDGGDRGGGIGIFGAILVSLVVSHTQRGPPRAGRDERLLYNPDRQGVHRSYREHTPLDGEAHRETARPPARTRDLICSRHSNSYSVSVPRALPRGMRIRRTCSG